MRRKRSSGLAVKWSIDRASGFHTGPLGHVITGSLCLVLLLTACEIVPSEQFTPQLVVHGLVLAGSSSVQVNINRTYAIDDPFDTTFADVNGMVWRGSDTWPFVNSVRDVYTARELNPGSASGDTFSIRIAKDGFDTVYGQTVVPDSFRILFPREGDTVSINDSMVWTRSRNCAGYYMSLQSIDRGDTFYYSLAIPNDTTGDNLDSLIIKFPQMVFLYQFEPGKHTLRVSALDTNYFDWVSARGFGPGSGTSETTRLSGGLGVFGSGVGESVGVYVRTDTGFRREPTPEIRSQSAGLRMNGRTERGEETGRATVGSVSRCLPLPVSRPQPATQRPSPEDSLARPAWE